MNLSSAAEREYRGALRRLAATVGASPAILASQFDDVVTIIQLDTVRQLNRRMKAVNRRVSDHGS